MHRMTTRMSTQWRCMYGTWPPVSERPLIPVQETRLPVESLSLVHETRISPLSAELCVIKLTATIGVYAVFSIHTMFPNLFWPVTQNRTPTLVVTPPLPTMQKKFLDRNSHLFQLQTQLKANKWQTIIIDFNAAVVIINATVGPIIQCQFMLNKICCG